MRVKITERFAATITPDQGRRIEIIDTVTAGLRLRANKDGSKTWSVITTGPDGKKVRATLGPHPDLTVAKARDRASAIKLKIRDGYTPVAAKAAAKEAAAAADNGITLHEGLDMYAASRLKAQRTGYQTERDLRRDFDQMLDQKAPNVTTAMVATVIDEKAKTAPTMARRLLAYARPWFKWMMTRGHIPFNPCDGIEAPGTETPRERILAPDEVASVWKAAGELGYPFGPFIRVLMLTGQRREEVAGMRRAELNINSATWIVPAARSKTERAITVPLPDDAIIQITLSLKFATGDNLVFTTSGDKPISGFSKAKQRLDRLSGVTGWRLHDFRRTMVSSMAEMGVDPAVADRCINHQASATMSTVARIYQQSDLLERRRHATAAWAAKIHEWRGRVSADNVFATVVAN
jgi:integrase